LLSVGIGYGFDFPGQRLKYRHLDMLLPSLALDIQEIEQDRFVWS